MYGSNYRVFQVNGWVVEYPIHSGELTIEVMHVHHLFFLVFLHMLYSYVLKCGYRLFSIVSETFSHTIFYI